MSTPTPVSTAVLIFAPMAQMVCQAVKTATRTSAIIPLISSRKRNRLFPVQSGFTLVEILVVVLIIGIGFAAALLSVDILGDDRELEDEARRLVTLISLANEEALLNGRTIGILVEETGYSFFSFDSIVVEDGSRTRQWLSMAADDFFKPRTFRNELYAELYLDDREIVLVDPEDTESPRPQIIILASGEATPFEMRISREFSERYYTLIGKNNGTLEIHDSDSQL